MSCEGASAARYWRSQESRYVAGGSKMFTVEDGMLHSTLFGWRVEFDQVEEKMREKGFSEEIIEAVIRELFPVRDEDKRVVRKEAEFIY